MLRFIFLFSFVLLALLSSSGFAGVVFNGSFETGDFSGWGTASLNTSIGDPLTVRPDGYTPSYRTSANESFFTTSATDGNFSATHGFDGLGPGNITIFQDIGVVDSLTNQLLFDYRAAWDLVRFGSLGDLDRVLNLDVYQAGDFSNQLSSYEVFRLTADTINIDTGNLTETVDLSAFDGQAIRISFDAFVPDNLSGPAFFQLDNVRLAAGVPEPSSLALLGVILAPVVLSRRRIG